MFNDRRCSQAHAIAPSRHVASVGTARVPNLCGVVLSDERGAPRLALLLGVPVRLERVRDDGCLERAHLLAHGRCVGARLDARLDQVLLERAKRRHQLRLDQAALLLVANGLAVSTLAGRARTRDAWTLDCPRLHARLNAAAILRATRAGHASSDADALPIDSTSDPTKVGANSLANDFRSTCANLSFRHGVSASPSGRIGACCMRAAATAPLADGSFAPSIAPIGLHVRNTHSQPPLWPPARPGPPRPARASPQRPRRQALSAASSQPAKAETALHAEKTTHASQETLRAPAAVQLQPAMTEALRVLKRPALLDATRVPLQRLAYDPLIRTSYASIHTARSIPLLFQPDLHAAAVALWPEYHSPLRSCRASRRLSADPIGSLCSPHLLLPLLEPDQHLVFTSRTAHARSRRSAWNSRRVRGVTEALLHCPALRPLEPLLNFVVETRSTSAVHETVGTAPS
eukprot:6181864-Pleurochrysis_carterae.AAC.1